MLMCLMCEHNFKMQQKLVQPNDLYNCGRFFPLLKKTFFLFSCLINEKNEM